MSGPWKLLEKAQKQTLPWSLEQDAILPAHTLFLGFRPPVLGVDVSVLL